MAVLVIGVSTQIGLEIIRSLGRQGIDVYALGSGKWDIGFFSRYTKRKFLVSFSPEEEFIKKLIHILKNHPEIETIFAIAERMLVRLNKYRDELEKYVKIPWPSQEILDFALDRRKTIKIAKSLNIPVPETIFLDCFEDIEKAKNLSFPVITKPALRNFSHPIQDVLDFRVKYFENYKDLKEHIKHFEKYNWFPMVQTCCQGEEIGFAIIMAQGEAVTCFQYHNEHLSPVKGGVPILRRSLPIDPMIKKYSIRLLKEIGWQGVAEIDYIRDHRDGQFKLLEINPRFWGGTPLPSKAGLSFPWLLYKSLIKEEKFYTEDYQIGIRCALLGGEITRTLELIRDKDSSFGISKLKAVLQFLKLFVDPYTKFDIQDKEDFLPGFLDCALMLLKPFSRRN